MATVMITGGTGLVGTALSRMLVAKGWGVIILTRKIPAKPWPSHTSYALWNVENQSIDIAALQQADHIVHLAGAGVVEKRWTAAYKKLIADSRVNSSKLLVKALSENSNKVQSIVSSSAIGWYGPDSNSSSQRSGFTEDAPPANDFLGTTCTQWEASIDTAASLGKRVVKLRTGIVLSKDGGALTAFKKPLKAAVAAILGSGQQVISWIHIEDLCRMFIAALENSSLEGAYNAVAPQPVTNKTLTLQLAQVMRGRFYIPVHVPAFVLSLVMGESSVEVLKSCTVSCEKIRKAGFTFLYPSIESALQQLCKHS